MTARTRRLAIAAAAALVLLPLLIDWCIESDEERVEATLDGLEAAFEARDEAAVLFWCTEEVEWSRTLPWLPNHTSLPAALHALLPRLSELHLSRGATTLTFDADGTPRVVAEGSGLAALQRGGGAPFRLDVELALREGDDGRYLVAAIARFEVGSLFR